MADIHATAIVSPQAELGDRVSIGPYCVVGDQVRLGEGTVLKSHVCIEGHTTLGRDNTVYPFASLGFKTQDLKYKGGQPRVEIGDRNTFREYVTVNAATDDGDATRVGSDCLVMAYVHIAHDCRVGNGVILANAATLAGHVILEDMCIIGGLCGIHQFVRVGRMSITGGCSKITQDVPPFMMADGQPLKIRGVNKVGLQRKGVSEEAQNALKKAYRILYRQDLSTRQALDAMESELEMSEEINYLASFIKSSERGITR